MQRLARKPWTVLIDAKADLLAFDPSKTRTGAAAFCGPTLIGYGSCPLRRSDTSLAQWTRRLAGFVAEVLNAYAAAETVCLIEEPAGGMYARRRRPGAVQGIATSQLQYAIAVGVVLAACHGHHLGVVTVTPGKWNGGRSKDATRLIVEQTFGLNGLNQDEADAIGMGLWATSNPIRFRMVSERSGILCAQ